MGFAFLGGVFGQHPPQPLAVAGLELPIPPTVECSLPELQTGLRTTP